MDTIRQGAVFTMRRSEVLTHAMICQTWESWALRSDAACINVVRLLLMRYVHMMGTPKGIGRMYILMYCVMSQCIVVCTGRAKAENCALLWKHDGEKILWLSYCSALERGAQLPRQSIQSNWSVELLITA